jgi:hypothetical protein
MRGIVGVLLMAFFTNCAAGTSEAGTPGVPSDVTGAPEDSMALSAEQAAAVAAARALQRARNPASQSAVDRGFAPAGSNAQAVGSGGTQ